MVRPSAVVLCSFLERRALEHAIDELAPLRVGRRRKFGGKRQIVGVVGHGRKMAREQAHGLTTKRGGSRSIPVASTLASASLTRTPAIDAVRRDIGERHQHERALEQPRVRQHQVGIVHCHVVIGDDVDVERARAPAALVGAVAAERAFDLLRARQQRMRRQAWFRSPRSN